MLGLALLVTASLYLFLWRYQTQAPNITNQSQQRSSGGIAAIPYSNERVGFSFNMPQGYRLATDYMRFLDETSGYPISDWSATNTQDVVITRVTDDREQQFVEFAKQGRQALEFNSISSFPESIYIAAVGGTLSTARKANAILPLPDKIIFRELTVSGADALRFTNHSNEQVVDIAFNASRTLSSGFPIGSIMVKMGNSTNTFDEPAFDEVVDSFHLIRTPST